MSAGLLNRRYRLDEELGRGGMSVVYRGRDTLLERDVAVKVLQRAEPGQDGWKRILAEARSAAKLNHPNIVAVYDVGETTEADGTTSPFIVMELVEGRSLHSDPPHDLPSIIAVASGMLEALGHAHAHGVVHRDLKPENVLLPRHGGVKLTDFGLAQSVASRLSQAGALIGTVFYIAPEQALGRPVDGRADLYAIGVMLYELVTGQLPFNADNALAVVSLHLHAPVVPPRALRADLPAAFDELILRLLEKRPEDRPATAHDVARALLGVLDAPAAAEEEHRLLDRIVRGRLVGRQRELSEALAHWQRAVGGAGEVLLVTGEPGIGKTRLVREITAHVEVTGGYVLSGECYAEGSAPYAPFAEVIRRALSGPAWPLLPEPVQAELVLFAPDLAMRLPNLSHHPSGDPAAQQQRAFEGFALFCEAHTAARPVLLFIDDVHWADAGSLQLIHYLARRLHRLPLLLVLTYREIELDENPALRRLLQDLNRERLASRLKLGRLTQDQTRMLLQAMFSEEITSDFLEGIYRESEGNPFFVEEICKALVDGGHLRFEGGRWHRPRVEDLEIPQSVRGAILSRVDKLPEPAREAMLMASILGREFEFETLRRATDFPEEHLIGALEAAERAQLISGTRRDGDIAFSFAHALIPASLSESVSVLRRKMLHRRAALAIEAAQPGAWEILAYHWIEAGEDEQARTASLRAGDHAYASLARAEAVHHYRAALERWPADDRAGRAEILAKLGDCLLVAAAGGVSDSYREARDLYQEVGDIVRVGEMERRLGRFYYEAGDRERSMQHYQQALKILEACPPTPELAMALSSMSQMLMLSSEYQESLRWGERAIALAADLDVEAVRVHALNNVACSWVGLGQTDKGLALLEESFDRAVAAGLPHDAARATMNQGDIFLNLARFAEAGRAYGELVDFAGRYHVHGFESSARERLVLTHWLMGEWNVALEVEQNLRETGALPAGLTQVWHAATVGLIYNDLGRPGEARQLLETQLEDAMRNDELQTTIPFLTQLARAHVLLGQPETGRTAVQDMLQRMDAIPFFDGSCGPGLTEIVYWIEAAEGKSGAVLGAACLERLQRMVAQVRPVDAAAMVDEVGAVVASMGRDQETAAALFASAAARWEALHRAYPSARAWAGQARALLALGHREQAYAALRRARAILEGLRAKLTDGGMRESFTGSGLFAGVLAAMGDEDKSAK